MSKNNLLPLLFVFLALMAAAPHQQNRPQLIIRDKNSNPTTKLTDGDSIQLSITNTATVDQATPVAFVTGDENFLVAECVIAKGANTCQTDPFSALGWHWNKNKQPQADRTVRAKMNSLVIASVEVQVAPRPVVFVHGFGSSADAWANYLGAKGFLASIGVRGFAVGDGQVKGKLNLGNLANPTGLTETLKSNAEILREYIASVKQITGAQMVDLVAHSMGNLVSRYYIDRGMPGRDIAQMIMLGPPNLGTDCAYLPSSLGYYLPAALEIRPSYVRNIFNPQITKRHGVPFTIVAGTPILEQLQSPCTAVPSDLAIALDSASGIQAPIQQTDVWHVDLNASDKVFNGFVKPLLQKTIGEYPAAPDPAPAVPADQDLQFTRVFTGHVDSGSSATITINIDSVAVASFALYDPTRSLTVTVRGATGNIIALDPTRNGLVVVRDPETLVYLGYGFNNPRPGPWQVTLQTTAATPPTGADYAITAQLKGGAILQASASTLLPKVNDPVQFAVRLSLGGQAQTIRDATTRIRYPDGVTRPMPMSAAGADWRVEWIPTLPGLYSVDLVVSGAAADGTIIERTAFLAVEAQPVPEQFQPIQTALIAGVIGVFGLILVLIMWRRRR